MEQPNNHEALSRTEAGGDVPPMPECIGDTQTKLSSALRSTISDQCIYQRDPLPKAESYIRLLRFLPNPTSGHIECELTIHKHNEAPPYRAVSYMWGHPVRTHLVVLGDAALPVISNCHYALWHISRCFESDCTVAQHYWMDSICIDQLNNAEKGAQVQMMYDIYERAIQVLVCIGPHEESSDFIFEVLEDDDLRRALLARDNAGLESKPLLWYQNHDPNPLSARVQIVVNRHWTAHGQPGSLFHHLQAFMDGVMPLLGRPYWNRLWIVQEIGAAKAVEVLCGDSAINMLARFWLNPGHGQGRDVTQFVRPFAFRKSEIRGRAVLPSNMAFTTFEKFECGDFRDHVYALLRLIDWPEHIRQLVKPDYRIGKLELIEQVADTVDAALKRPKGLRQLQVFLENMSPLVRSIHWDCCDEATTRMVNDRLLKNSGRFMLYAQGARWEILPTEEPYLPEGVPLVDGRKVQIDAVLKLTRRKDWWFAFCADPGLRLQPVGTIHLGGTHKGESRTVLLNRRNFQYWDHREKPTGLAQFVLRTAFFDTGS